MRSPSFNLQADGLFYKVQFLLCPHNITQMFGSESSYRMGNATSLFVS